MLLLSNGHSRTGLRGDRANPISKVQLTFGHIDFHQNIREEELVFFAIHWLELEVSLNAFEQPRFELVDEFPEFGVFVVC